MPVFTEAKRISSQFSQFQLKAVRSQKYASLNKTKLLLQVYTASLETGYEPVNVSTSPFSLETGYFLLLHPGVLLVITSMGIYNIHICSSVWTKYTTDDSHKPLSMPFWNWQQTFCNLMHSCLIITIKIISSSFLSFLFQKEEVEPLQMDILFTNSMLPKLALKSSALIKLRNPWV